MPEAETKIKYTSFVDKSQYHNRVNEKSKITWGTIGFTRIQGLSAAHCEGLAARMYRRVSCDLPVFSLN